MKLRLNKDFIIDSNSAPWNVEGIRICLFGGPGSGKSWSASLLAEQWLHQGGTLVVFEPRSEYHTLKEKFDVVVFGGVYGKDMDFLPITPKVYAKALVEDGVSMVFYTSDIEKEEKLISFTATFIKHVLKLQEIHKRPILLIMEEAQEYAPLSTRGRQAPPWIYGRMIKAFKDCFLQGRKLNVSTIAVSPRPQEINFTIRQLANLTFYGKFSPQDIGYIDRECFKYYRQKGEHTQAAIYKANDLLDLTTGKWLIIMGKTAKFMEVTEPRITRHGAETPKLTYTAPRKQKTKRSMQSLAQTLKQALKKEQTEQSELEKQKRKTKQLEKTLTEQDKELERMRTALEVAGKIKFTPIESKEVSQTERNRIVQEQTRYIQSEINKVFANIGSDFPKRNPLEKQPTTPDLYAVWAPKMPSKCARRIFKFLLNNKTAKYTKAQIGVSLGYKTSSGTFNGALSFLKQNNLIQHDGKYLWTE